MARTLTAGAIAQLASAKLSPALLAYFDFASGAIRVWTGTRPIVFDSNTFTGLGDLVSVSQITEQKGTKIAGLTFTLNGVPSAMISIALADSYRGRACSLWLGFLDSSDALVADPIPIFSGRMDTMRIEDSGDTSTITVQAESRFIELERSHERRFTDQDQQQLFPGDLGLEYVAGLQDKEIAWGQVATTAVGSGGGGGSNNGDIVPP